MVTTKPNHHSCGKKITVFEVHDHSRWNEQQILTSGNSLNTASSAAAFALSILEEDDVDAPKQDTCINLAMPPCSLAICAILKMQISQP